MRTLGKLGLAGLEKIVCVLSSISAPFVGLGIGHIAGLILGFMNENDVSKIDSYGKIGGYIGAGLGILTTGLVMENVVLSHRHENDERYWETHSSLKKEETLEHVLGELRKFEKDLSAYPDELNRLYESAGWYSVRYAAGKVLGKNEEELNKNLDSWLCLLQQGLKSTKEVMKSVIVGCEEREIRLGKCGDDGRAGPDIVYEDVYEVKPFNVPHTAQRLNCVSDLGELSRLLRSTKVRKCLKEVYLKNDSPPVRRRAGRELGYSKLRVTAQEYPAITGMASLSAIGLATYCLLQHLM